MKNKVVIVVEQEYFDTIKEFADNDRGRAPEYSFASIVFKMVRGAKVVTPQPRPWYNTLLNRWGVK